MAYGTIPLNPGTGGGAVAKDTIAGADFQRMKVAAGTEGNATDVSATNPLPVTISGGPLIVGQQAVTATAVALASNACKEITVKAMNGNQHPIYVCVTGGTTATGFELSANQSTPVVKVSNTNLIFIVTSAAGVTAGVTVCWIATN